MDLLKPKLLIDNEIEWLQDIIEKSKDVEDVLKHLGIENSTATRPIEHFVSYVAGISLEPDLSYTRLRDLRRKGLRNLKDLHSTLAIEYFLTSNGVTKQRAGRLNRTLVRLGVTQVSELESWLKTPCAKLPKGISYESFKILKELFNIESTKEELVEEEYTVVVREIFEKTIQVTAVTAKDAQLKVELMYLDSKVQFTKNNIRSHSVRIKEIK